MVQLDTGGEIRTWSLLMDLNMTVKDAESLLL